MVLWTDETKIGLLELGQELYGKRTVEAKMNCPRIKAQPSSVRNGGGGVPNSLFQ